MILGLKKYSQLQIGKDIRVELQIPPSPNVDLTTPRVETTPRGGYGVVDLGTQMFTGTFLTDRIGNFIDKN
ncbi:hypothetical protein D0X99_17465 [Algoriphagus lacus]|uniref:Uncharacterized protein n=1 Tax=Algoriphagus lacus TaxID=2056311 RepID=A0A418PN74_9BACT|nr:hypothetical protein D0X99_17465 [Algoriphagus lacus]